VGSRYNEVAGQSVERLAALSDGLFAVAMTLLVLNLHAPASEAVHTEADLWRALVTLAPRLLVYLTSFLTLGIFWAGQQTRHNFLARGDRNLAWIHLAFLFAVSLVPVSTALIAEFIGYRIALLTYWANILLIGTILLASWRYAIRVKLVKHDIAPEIAQSVERRIVIGQALYAFGALLCVVNTFWSIAFIMLVQLNYAVAPRIAFLRRL
jgi:uncharacterized membrane protein